MAYQVGDVIARIGLQVMTGQFNTASQAFRSLGYDAVFMGKQFTTANGAMGAFEKKIGSFSSNAKLIGSSINGISNALKGATTEWRRVESHFEKVEIAGASLSSNLSSLGKGVLGLGLNFASLIVKLKLAETLVSGLVTIGLATWVYKVHSEFEQLNVRLKYVTGSAQDAEVAFKWVQKFAKETPMDVAGVTDAFARLAEKGFDSVQALPRIVDAIAGIGGSTKQLDGVIYALTQMSALPKGIAQEFRQLANQGISAISLLNKTYGLSLKSADDAIKHFGNGAKVADALITAMGIKFQGIAKEMNSTLKGQLQEMTDNFKNFAYKIGESGALGSIKNFVKAINDRFDEMANNGSYEKIAKQISEKIGTSLMSVINITVRLTQAFMVLAKWTMIALNPIDAFDSKMLDVYAKRIDELSNKFGVNSAQVAKARAEYEAYSIKLKNSNPDALALNSTIKMINESYDGLSVVLGEVNSAYQKSGTKEFTKEQARIKSETDKLNNALHASDYQLGIFKSNLKESGNEASELTDEMKKLIEKTKELAHADIVSGFEYAFETFQFDFGGIIDDFANAGADSGRAFVSQFGNSMGDLLGKGIRLASGGTASWSEIRGNNETGETPSTKVDAFSNELLDYGKQIGIITDDSLALSNTFNKYQDMVKAGIITQKEADNAVDSFAKTLYQTAPDIVSKLQGLVNNYLHGVSVAIVDWIQNGDFGDLMKSAWEGIKSIVGSIGNMFSGNGFSDMLSSIKNGFDAMLKSEGFQEFIWQALIKIVDALGILGVFESIFEGIAIALEPIKELFDGLGESFMNAIGSIALILQPIAELFAPLFDLISQIALLLQPIAKLLGKTISIVTNPVKGIFGGLFHDGGSVGAPFKYHNGASVGLPSGTFKQDEVPAVLQTGEIVLDRQTVASAKRQIKSSGSADTTPTEQLLRKMLSINRRMLKNQIDWTTNGLLVASE